MHSFVSMRLNARLSWLFERGRLTAAVEALKTAFACLTADPTTTEGGDTCVKAAVALLFLWRRSLLVLHLGIVSDLAMLTLESCQTYRLWGRVTTLRVTLRRRTIALGRRVLTVAAIVSILSCNVLGEALTLGWGRKEQTLCRYGRVSVQV